MLGIHSNSTYKGTGLNGHLYGSLDMRKMNGMDKQYHKPILGRTKQVLYGLFFGPYYKGRMYTLLVFCSFGLVGVCIDLDHIISPLFKTSRPLHIPYFFAFWILLFCYSSYVYRRVYKTSLKR